MSSSFANVLFDLGVVLLHLDYPRAIRRALPLCDLRRIGGLHRFMNLAGRDPIIHRYECGTASAREFFERFVELTGYRGGFDGFCATWQDIFTANRPMIEFARALAAGHNLYIFSNAGDLHFPYVYRQFPELREIFKGDAVSFELGVMKPDRAYFERGLARHRLRAANCLFIDDRPENVAGARACGLTAVRYTNPAATISETRRLLAEFFAGKNS